MSLHLLINTVETLDEAIFATINPGEREELEEMLDKLHLILRRHGVFVGTQFPRPRRGQTNPGRDGAAPGSTTKG
jgi:hypothetical protein